MDKDTWELVQQLRKTKRVRDGLGEVSPLTGLVRCESCGGKMYHHRSKKGNHDYYECANYSNSRAKFASDHCSPHSCSSKSIKVILLDVIQKTTAYVREHENDFIKMVQENTSLRQGQTLKSHTRKITKNERRIAELDKLFSSLYEDKVQGVITAERFAQMSNGFEQEQQNLREENITLQSEVDVFNEDNEKVDKFISLVQKYTRIEELTPTVINEFIDSIVVYQSEWSEATEENRRMGTRSQRIDVHLKYIGDFSVPDNRTDEEIEAERIKEEKAEERRKKQREYMREKNAAKKLAKEKEKAVAVKQSANVAKTKTKKSSSAKKSSPKEKATA